MTVSSYVTEESTVVVTGAAGGIGGATAHSLAGDGIAVTCCDRNADALHAVVESIRAAGGTAVSAVGDVSSEDDCRRFIETAVSLGRPLTGLVNNAAVGAFALTVENTTLEEWNRYLAINLTSVFLMSKYAIPHLRQAGGGAIVNVSSIHAYATSTGVAPYAAAKGGVLALTRAMALDLAADGIRVTCLIPGPIDTPMLRSHAEREGTTLEALGFPSDERAIGHVAQPGEAASAIRFLLSSDASYVTGSSLQVDGGILAKF